MYNQQIGFRPGYQKLCKYCKQVDIALVYEHVGNNVWKWVARNYNTGSIHNCINSNRSSL